jgi:hypothetical protein
MNVKRIAPLSGIIFVILAIAAIGGLGGNTPDGSDSPEKVTAFYLNHHTRESAAAHLLAVAILFLVIYAVGTYMALPKGRGEIGKLGDLVFLLGGAIAAAGFLVEAGLHLAVSEGVNDHISPIAAQAIAALDTNTYILFSGGFGILLIGAAAAMVPHPGALRWLGWVAVIVGIACFTPLAFAAMAVAAIWIIVASIVVARLAPDGAATSA